MVGANQIDLPRPFTRTRIPFVAMWNQLLRNATQPLQLRIRVGGERVFLGGFFQHLAVLLTRRSFDLGSGNQFGECRLFARVDVHAIAGQQMAGSERARQQQNQRYPVAFAKHSQFALPKA